jgi:hypothetical protein
MPSQYVLYKGTHAALSTLPSTGKSGVLAYTTDTQQVYVDSGSGIGIGTAWLLIGGSGSSGVSQIIAGTNVTISPSGGTGAVTVNASGGSSPTFVDNETVSGGGTSWTLAYPPSVGCVPILMVPPFTGYGLFGLIKDSTGPYGYTISGENIVTVTSFATGVMRAWYRTP